MIYVHMMDIFTHFDGKCFINRKAMHKHHSKLYVYSFYSVTCFMEKYILSSLQTGETVHISVFHHKESKCFVKWFSIRRGIIFAYL